MNLQEYKEIQELDKYIVFLNEFGAVAFILITLCWLFN